MNVPDRTLSTREVFKGRFLSVRVDEVQISEGGRSTLEIAERGGAAAVVALDGDNVILVRQHRQAVSADLLELPAGLIGEGEAPEACAARELAEEVGMAAENLDLLCAYFSSAGFTDERVHVFIGTELRRLDSRHLDPGEEVDVVELRFDEALALVDSGAITDAKTVIGLLLAERRRRPLQ